MLASIFGDPRRQDFLQGRQGPRRKHPRPQGVLLQLLNVGLQRCR